MRILYIHEYFTNKEKNGANIVAFNNYYSMIKNGKECYFYAVNKKPYIEEQNINKLFPESHIGKNNLLYRLNSLFNISAKINLDKVINEIKPDIVHIHSTLELSSSIILSLKKHNIPYIITVHDGGYSCPVMGTKYLLCDKCTKNPLSCIKLKCSKNNYFNSFYMMIKFIINQNIISSYLPKKIITPSLALKKYILNTHSYDGNFISCIPNHLDNVFENVEPNYSNENYFLYVGGLIDIKGVNILLKAVKELPKDIQFYIAGGGQQESEYRKFVKDNELNNVKFIGKLDRKELIKAYQNCIALITPSNCFEIFGMINIEAFINGKPVIASNIGGIPEIIEHNKTGLLFEPGNAEQLKECILTYWNNRNLVIEHGKNAREKSLKNYTEKSYSEKLIKIYNEVLCNAK